MRNILWVSSVVRGLHVWRGSCITGWKWVIEFLVPCWDGCHGNWQSPPARCVCHLSSDSVPCFYLLFSRFFIGLVIPTVTWLRSGVRLTGLRFIFTAIKGFWITRDHYSEYSFILMTHFVGWRIISPLLNEIPLLPRCGFLVICPRCFSFFLFFFGLTQSLSWPIHLSARP